MLDKDPIRISKFEGLYDRSVDIVGQLQIVEEIPFGYARIAENVIPSVRGIQNRPGIIPFHDENAVVSEIYYTVQGTIAITGAGFDLYANNVLVQAAYSEHISIVQRLFGNPVVYDVLVSPVSSVAAENILLVNSVTGAFRNAAGATPTFNPAAANGAAGKVEAGIHLFATVFETNTGFITKYIQPATAYTAPGALKVNLTNIEVGPAGTVARRIVATKVIHQYDGNPANYEFFYVPGGRIADNVTTILTVDFIDSEMLSTADDLNDLETVLTDYTYLCTYHNRAVYLKYDSTTPTKGSDIVLSLPGSFESVSLVDGVLSNSAFKGAISAFVYQDNLYIMTLGAQAYVLRDNGGPPNTWESTIVSSEATSISQISHGKVPIKAINLYGNPSNQLDYNVIENAAIITTKEGLFAFRGDFNGRPLTWNIDRLWNSVLFGTIGLAPQIKVRIDPDKKYIYILGSLGGTVIIGDYKNGLNWNTIRWFVFRFPFEVRTGDVIGSISLISQNLLLINANATVHNYIVADGNTAGVENRDTIFGGAKAGVTCIYETGLLPESDNLDDMQNSEIRLNQYIEGLGSGDFQTLISFGFGISGSYRNYQVTATDAQIQTFNIIKLFNRETFKWFFTTVQTTGYRAVELLDALIFFNDRAATRPKK